MTDWQAWHGDYDEPTSSLSRRLRVVQRRLDEVLDAHPVGRVLSLCAGDGRDVLPVVARREPAQRPELVLVELDPGLAEAAQQRAEQAGVEATVVVGDAGASATWRQAVPVDVLMLCGVFGNISDVDVQVSIDAAKAVLAPGGTVLWTRGAGSGPDPRPLVRQWFADAGFSEVAFDAEPGGFGVGVSRLGSAAGAGDLPVRLFSFIR